MRYGKQSFLAALLLVPILVLGLSPVANGQLPQSAVADPSDAFPIDTDIDGDKWVGTLYIYWPFVGNSPNTLAVANCQDQTGSPEIVHTHFVVDVSFKKQRVHFGGTLFDTCFGNFQAQADAIKDAAAAEFTTALGVSPDLVRADIALLDVSGFIVSDSDTGRPSDPFYLIASIKLRVNS